MKKSKIKAGFLVELRDGTKCLIIPNQNGLQLATTNTWVASITSYNDELKNCNDKKYDIVKIYGLAINGRFFNSDNRELLYKESTRKYKVGDYVQYKGTLLIIKEFSSRNDGHYRVLPVDTYGVVIGDYHEFLYDDNDLKPFTPLKVLMFDGEEIKVGDTLKGNSYKAHLKVVKIFDDYCECDWYADDNNKFKAHSSLLWSSRNVLAISTSRFTARYTPVTHKEMTVEQIEKALGHPVKVIK